MTFRLRFPASSIPEWALRFEDGGDDILLERMRAPVTNRGYLQRDEFLAVCRWKTPRSAPLCARNDARRIRGGTEVALARATTDREKIESLRSLSGVGWPTASVILHFFDEKPFPILDVRALWSVTRDARSSYTHDFWAEYTRFTRELAQRAGCDMRTLDRALWQYSMEKQPGGRRKR